MDHGSHKIYEAFHNGDHKLSSELLLWGTVDTNIDSIKDCCGDTLLHLACQNGWLDHAKYLIKERGCKPDVRDCGNQTPLHYACRYGHLNIVKYLIEVHNCDIAVATKDYWTPLHYACHYGHSNIIEYILDIPGVTGRK